MIDDHTVALSAILVLLTISSGFAIAGSSVLISNSGVISVISPLHTEGKYIKDAQGNIVRLRGVNKAEFADNPGAAWMGIPVSDYGHWKSSDVIAELTMMKSWGINVIRTHQAVENWKNNLGQHRRIIKELLSLAASKGMYVIYDGYCVRNYWNGSQQDPLPYPPYQLSANASTIIASQDDFVDYWISIATELKDHPNVIFELWNEPYGDDVAKQSWFSVAQRTINAIRATGANQLIIFQWEMGVWVNLDFPPPSGDSVNLSWVWEANLTDPIGNLVYSAHIYRVYGCFHRSFPTRYNVWNYTDIQLAFQYFRFPDVLAQYPLIIGEIGADLAYTGDELQKELTAFDNCLKVCDAMGIQYTAFWWRSIGLFRLHSGAPDFTPNEAGLIVKTNLLGS